MPSAYRIGLDITNAGTISGANLRAVTEEWGSTLAKLGVATLDTSAPTATINIERVGEVTYRDRLSSRYFHQRFEFEFPNSLKTLLLLIEGDLSTALTLLPQTATGHEQAVFRACTITLYHSLTALQHILERYSKIDSSSTRRLRDLLDDTPTRRLLSREGQRVRNRCMHYEFNDPTIRIDPSLPMFGIVESAYPGNNWEQFKHDVVSVSNQVANQLSDWTPTTVRARRLLSDE